MHLLTEDKWLRHLLNKKEVIGNKIAPTAFDYFKPGRCGLLELSGKSCKKAKSDFHEKAIEKAKKHNNFNYSGFLMVDFCRDCIIRETIQGTEYIFMCFYTPKKEDETHCDLILLNKNSLSFMDKVHLSRYSKTFKIMTPKENIFCC